MPQTETAKDTQRKATSLTSPLRLMSCLAPYKPHLVIEGLVMLPVARLPPQSHPHASADEICMEGSAAQPLVPRPLCILATLSI
mmetsp:Transcript_25365/g.83899  ORF Transcript_25365/g.83899 Transcript_25365/m.83899 type:complete len:84 (+) Transcript_25365:1500-1751(+)